MKYVCHSASQLVNLEQIGVFYDLVLSFYKKYVIVPASRISYVKKKEENNYRTQ